MKQLTCQGRQLGLNYSCDFFPFAEEEQETSGDFGSGGSVLLLDDLEEAHEEAKKDKQKIHVRATNEDDEDEDDDKDDEIGYIW